MTIVLRPISYFTTTVILLTLLVSCQTTREIEDPEVAYEQKKYMIAAELFQEEIEDKETDYLKARVAYKIGESYRMANKKDKAVTWYRQAADYGYGPQALYYQGLMLKSLERYEDAIKVFQEYANAEPLEKAKAQNQIQACKQAKKWIEEETNMNVSIPENINSEYSDFAPVLYQDHSLVFSSSRPDSYGDETYGWTGEEFSDFFQTSKNYTKYHEGAAIFSSDGSTMYFTRCGSSGEEDDYCLIYKSQKKPNGVWGEAKRIQFFEDSVNVGHPYLTQNGERLFFSSDAEGGYGKNDLYYVNKTATGWSSPINLGNAINTKGDELFPYLGDDKKLYFASDGHKGMGGLDIFTAQKKGNKWVNPKNMKPPINSGADDFGLIYDKTGPRSEEDKILESGYFCSTRPGGKGNDDIYRFERKNISFYELEGVVKRPVYKDPTDPNSEVVDHEKLPQANVDLLQQFRNKEEKIASQLTGEDASFHFELERSSNYKVMASNEGYFSKSKNVTTKGKNDPDQVTVTIRIEIILEKIFEEKEIVIPNIYYDYDSSSLRDKSKPVLEDLAKLLKENKNIKIEIGSHTDSRGSDAYNQRLSKARAESVIEYLVSKGVNPQRLLAKGYGESQLVNDCVDGVDCTEEEHQKNRRTTFKVVSSDFVKKSVQPDEIEVDPREKDKEQP
ncbi:MAG: hypothetical protein BRD50_06560 [Bacteroidetes bacterium SW_11_45_7]|nr:MAG: hypothetical protein BRD50_06560 [Bacteroidetes bacterium SW_11_45_7]